MSDPKVNNNHEPLLTEEFIIEFADTQKCPTMTYEILMEEMHRDRAFINMQKTKTGRELLDSMMEDVMI